MINDLPTVLLVEDNRDDEELTIRSFKGANLANPVDVARDGQEALDYSFSVAAVTCCRAELRHGGGRAGRGLCATSGSVDTGIV